MATITNIGDVQTIIRNINGASIIIAPEEAATVADDLLPYYTVRDGVTKGWITVTDYTRWGEFPCGNPVLEPVPEP
jgi:methyl coenzyme M reductase subunit D